MKSWQLLVFQQETGRIGDNEAARRGCLPLVDFRLRYSLDGLGHRAIKLRPREQVDIGQPTLNLRLPAIGWQC